MSTYSSLQALNALCFSVRSFLGPDQRIKCMIEDEVEASSLISSCSEFLSKLEVEHPVGHVALEACLAHQKANGSGTTTLMTMAGFWGTEMEALLIQGVPVEAIIKYGDECLEQCQATLDTIAVSCSQVSHHTLEPHRTPEADLENNPQASGKSCTSEHQDSLDNDRLSLVAPSEAFDFEKDFASDEEEEPFLEVQLNMPIPQPMILKPTSSTREQVTDSPSKPETSCEDDDISWYFERETEPPECPLDLRGVNREALSTLFDDDKHYEDGLGPPPQVTNHQVHKEFASDSPVNGQQVQDDSDDEFDSCFPIKDVTSFASQSPLGDSSGKPAAVDELESCLPVEELDTEQKIPSENGRPCRDETTGGVSDTEQDEFDSCFSSVSSGNSAQLQESFQKDRSDVRTCNTNSATAQRFAIAHLTPSAIEESLQNLLREKQKDTVSKRLSNIQNNSRHFRSVETVLSRDISKETNSTSSCHGEEAVTKTTKTKVNSMATSVMTAALSGENGVSHQRELETGTSLLHAGLLQNVQEVTNGTISESHAPDTMDRIVKERMKKAAAKRLSNVLNNSRHFGTNDLTHLISMSKNPSLALDPGSKEHSEKPNSLVREPCPKSRDTGVSFRSWYLQNERHPLDLNQTPESTTFSSLSLDKQEIQHLDRIQEPHLEHLGLGLSHGSDLEMRLVIESFRIQQVHAGRRDRSTRWPDLNRVNVCSIAGPSTSDSRLEVGLLLPIDDHQRTAVAEAEGKHLKALLVNGDASPTFRHAGYKNKVKMTTVVSSRTGLVKTEDNSWLRDMTTLLQELAVGLVVLKGRADEHLLHHCLSTRILLLQDVPYRTLQSLGEACSTDLLTYLADATEDDTACGISVACWETAWVDRGRARSGMARRKTFARIHVDGTLLQTAVLCHPVSNLLSASETRFWSCAHRLQGCLEDGQYLHGAGRPEQMTIKQLQKLQGSNSTSCYRGNLSVYKDAVVSAFAEGFVRYLMQVLTNMGKMSDASQVRAAIMISVQRDRLEPVLSSCDQSALQRQYLYGSGGLNRSKPDLSSSIQMDSCKSCTTHDTIMSHEVSDSHTCSDRSEPDQTGSVETYAPNSHTHSHQSEPVLAGHSQSHVPALIHNRTEDPIEESQYGPTDDTREVYDSYSAKRLAWANAWALLKTVLLTDAHIVTGLQSPHSQTFNRQKNRYVIL